MRDRIGFFIGGRNRLGDLWCSLRRVGRSHDPETRGLDFEGDRFSCSVNFSVCVQRAILGAFDGELSGPTEKYPVLSIDGSEEEPREKGSRVENRERRDGTQVE